MLRTKDLEITNLVKHLQNENTNLISRNSQIDRSLVDYKNKIVTKMNEIKHLQGKIKRFKGELNSCRKSSVKKDSEILSLKSKLFELEIELEHLKSEGSSRRSGASSLQLNLPDQEKLPLGKTVSGGNEIQEENVSEVTRYPS